MRNYYPGITLFKLWGCIMVVFGHEMLAHNLLSFPNQQFRFVTLMMSNIVPCFYMVSGFLAYKGWSKAPQPRKYVFNYMKWILIIYSLFSVAFVIEFSIPALIHGGFYFGTIVNQFKMFCVAIVLNGPYLQLWFIPPLIFGVGLSFLFLAHNWQRQIVFLTIFGFIISLFLRGTLHVILPEKSILYSFKYSQYVTLFISRYFGFGLTFVLMGVLIAKYEHLFLKSKIKTWLISSVVLAVIEGLLLMKFAQWNNNYVLAISFLPSTLLVFHLLLKIKFSPIKTYHKFINIFSMVTYFGHIFVMQFNSKLLNWQMDKMTVLQGILFYLLTLAECWLITILLVHRPTNIKSKSNKRLAS